MDEKLELIWKRLYWGTLLLGFLVVSLGAWTRLADAGLGCPDWPGCYGQIMVPSSSEEASIAYPEAPLERGKAHLEMVHRYVAGLLGLAILGLFVLALLGADRRRKRITRWLLLLVVVQAGLGALTVTMRLFPPVVMAHLLMGFATLILLWNLRPPPHWRIVGNALKPHLLLCWLVLIAQIALGGWMSANYAALACPDFPTCQGQWWPPMDVNEALNTPLAIEGSYLGGKMDGEGRTTIHMAHRINAILLLGVLVAFFLRLRAVPNAGATATLGLWILGIQVLFGISLVLTGIPLFLAVLHNLFALLLAICLAHVSSVMWRRPEVGLDTTHSDFPLA